LLVKSTRAVLVQRRREFNGSGIEVIDISADVIVWYFVHIFPGHLITEAFR